jgi:hypothetical protein
MVEFRQGWESFKAGLDRRDILDYWKALWNHAWETWWGGGVVGAICTIFTLYYAPSRWILGWVVAWVFLVAGYYVWRPYHIRLIPKLEVGDIVVTRIPPDAATQKFVQLTVRCANDGTINDCRGQLLRVLRWSASAEWEPTQICGTIDLLWSELDVPSVILEPGAPRRLVIFAIENNNWDILVWDAKRSSRVPLPYSPGAVFKFDLRIGEPGFKAEYRSIKVTFGQQWGEMALEVIASENQ